MGKKQKTNGGDAVIYARYSSHNQRDVSIEQQVEACRKHAAELGLTVTATYEDRAISGKTDKRPSFQRMMRDAEQHKFAYVLAWKSNRIGRNMMQALVNESRLVDCGVKVFYAEEDFDDNAAGRFALRSMMNVNQFYIENMAEDVKRGLYDNAKKGLVNGSLPLGYKRGADGKPEIDEPKAAIVREIYTRVAAGELFASIAADLNARGIRTARGREWNKGSFHVLCHNDRYRGIYMYGDIRIPGGMPRIISDELFYDAQEAYGMKKDNRYGRARHGAENYLLTGKLYCGHCGSYMVGISGTSKTGEMHYYYACQKHRLEHTCEKKAIRRDVIENAVARAIMMYCLDDETIDFIVDSTIAYFKQKDHELHIEAMENELAAVQQAISNLMKAIEAGIITPTTRTRLLDLEEQQAKLSAKINTAKAERVEIDRDDLIAGLQLFRTGDIKNKKFLAKLFNTFLLAVYLYDDNRLKIVFSFTGNHNNIEIPLELDNDCPDSESGPYETEVRMSHLECRKNLGSPPSSGEAEKGDDCSDGRFVRTAPLPPQQFDLTYNLFKRLANDTSDMPTSIPDADMLKCCGWLYGKISHRLREESDVYGGILGDASFEKIFEGCPFVARMLALNADKDYPPLFQTIEMPEEEQKYDTDVLNGFFSKLAQSASIQAQNNNESAKNENASMLEQSDMDAEKTKKAQQTEAIAKDLNLSPNGGQQEKQ